MKCDHAIQAVKSGRPQGTWKIYTRKDTKPPGQQFHQTRRYVACSVCGRFYANLDDSDKQTGDVQQTTTTKPKRAKKPRR